MEPTKISEVRLVDELDGIKSGGYKKFEGRLEIFHNNKWGTINKTYFSDIDATVACRSMGLSGGLVKEIS